MIDFQNGDIFKLRNTGRFQNEKLIAPLFVSGEEFLGEYQAIRDFVIFTNKRAIAVNVQGVTGKKKISLPCPTQRSSSFPSRLPVSWISTANWKFISAGSERLCLNLPDRVISQPSPGQSANLFFRDKILPQLDKIILTAAERTLLY